MKKSTLLAIILTAVISACDVQSGMTKKSLEKYSATPTPERIATPVETIDPADVITIDTATSGPAINVNTTEEAKRVRCGKYNRVSINTDDKDVNVDGACKQIMVNGDKNRIKVTAVSEVVLNGHDNTVEHVKYVNGKKPFVTDSGGGNTIVKAPPPTPAK